MADRIQQRRDTAARWAQYNPILLEGEVGYELDTDQYKVGDGEHAWNDLAYRGDPCLNQRGQSTTTPMSQRATSVGLSKNDYRAKLLDTLQSSANADGSSSCLVDDIVLSQVGDYIEFDVKPKTSDYGSGASNGGGYSFSGYNPALGTTALGICSSDPIPGTTINDLCVRDDTGKWVISSGVESGTGLRLFSSYEFRKLKVLITATGIQVFLNGELKTTANWPSDSSKRIKINNFFHSYATYGYWKGNVRNFRIVQQGVDSGLLPQICDLPGFVTDNLGMITDSGSFLTSDEKTEIKEGTDAYDLLNSLNDFATSLKSGNASSTIARADLDKRYNINAVGDYIEIRCSNPQDDNRSSNNIVMFIGELCNAGFYINSFYFRSNSQQGADYRTWAFPSGFDKSVFHTYKLLLVQLDTNNQAWELFVDEVSWGTKTISSNANLSQLMGRQSSAVDRYIEYIYKFINIHSAESGDLSWNSQQIYNASVNGKLILSVNDEELYNLQKQVNENSDEIEGNTNSIKQLSSVYQTDSYFSGYNHKYETDGIQSITQLQKTYLIQNVGDYFEIEAKYWGNSSGFGDKLSLITGTVTNSRFGWYGVGQIWFRVAGEAYKVWNVSSLNLNWSEFHKYKLLVVNGGYELFIDGISCGTVENNLVEGTNYRIQYIASAIIIANTPQKYDVRGIKIHSSADGDEYIRPTALYTGSTNVDLVYAPEVEESENNPLCFVSYNPTTKYFDIYLRDKQYQNIYYGFKVYLASSRGTIDDPIFYRHFWELTNNGYIYRYNKSTGSMTSTGAITIAGGESECVFMYTDPNGSKVDFTGGVHGDESIDVVEGDFVHFYIDGVKLTEAELSTVFSLFPCNEFSYIQKSHMHQTAYRLNNKDTGMEASGAGVLTIDVNTHTFVIDGVDTNIPAYNQNTCYRSTAEMQGDGVTLSKSSSNTWVLSFVRQVYADHPVIATHLKQTVFKDQKYTTENVLIFNNDRTVSLWYHGICCLGKGVAQIGHNENFEDHTFVGADGPNALQAVGYRLFESYNPTTMGSGRVRSWITDGGGVLDDSQADMFIVDRVNDSKYYRTVRAFVPPVDKRLVSFMEVEFNFKDGSTV